MRRVLALIVFALLVTPAFAVDWLPYTDADAGFSIDFPGIPTLTHNQDLKAADGSIIPMTNYTVVTDNDGVFFVSVTDLGSLPVFDAHVAIDGCAEGFLRGHTKLSDAPVEADGQVGRAVSVQDGNGIITDEIFFLHHHLFQIVTGRPVNADADVQAMVVRFNQSLHFVNGKTS